MALVLEMITAAEKKADVDERVLSASKESRRLNDRQRVGARGTCSRSWRFALFSFALASFQIRKLYQTTSATISSRRLTGVAAGGGGLERAEALASLVSTARSYGIRRS